MSARRKVEKELTREIIMDAASNLFAEKGYQQVSMRQIAKKLNCSHGAIYYHFNNKAELFYALVEHHFVRLDKKLEKIAGQDLPGYEKLRLILQGFIEFGLTHQNHYEIMFLLKDEEVQSYINENPNKTYQKFANYVAALSGQQLTVQEIWSIFLSLHGFVTHYLRHVTSFSDVKGMAEIHVNLLLSIIKK